MPHTPLDWRRALTLLDPALALEPGPRELWLAQLEASEPGVGPLLRRLLGSHQQVESNRMLETLPRLAPDAAARDRTAGRRVGPFVLVEMLGEGGMGSVWRARYADGHLKRDVAVKLPTWRGDAATLAMLRERFARERDFLAQLEHPNIARLYDAGVSDDGQPFLALELVVGQTLDIYCDGARLPLKARLRLFLQVLDAVACAHQQLVLHRDLKPSNVLVDEQQQVRLLDFGVARLLPPPDAPTAADRTRRLDLTEQAGVALTLAYAAPEQLDNGALSTATDVYALGVMLYGLLTGLSPYDPERATRGGLEDAVLTATPAPASARSYQADALRARDTTAAALRKALRGDLDVILAKALKKKAAERYATVTALAEDLRAHLAQMPISARPDSWWYRPRLFVARHRIAVGVSCMAGAALLTTTGIAAWNAHQASRETARANAAQQFMAGLIGNADPEKNKDTGLLQRQLLAHAMEQAEQTFAATPETLALVLKQIAEIYDKLGQPAGYLEAQKKRVALYDRTSFAAIDDIVDARLSLGEALRRAGDAQDRARAFDVLKSANALAESRGASAENVVRTLCQLAEQMVWERKLDEAARYADRAVDLAERKLPNPSEVLAFAYQEQSQSAAQLGLYEQARTSLRKAMAIDATGKGRGPVEQFSNRNSLADLEWQVGNYEASAQVAFEALDYARSHLGEMGARLTTLRTRAVSATERAGDLDKAALLATQLLAVDIESGDPERIGRARMMQGIVALSRGEWAQAEHYLDAAQPGLAPNQFQSDMLRVHRATRSLLSGDAASALALLEPQMARLRAAGTANTQPFLRGAERSGVALARLGRLDDARAAFEDACRWRIEKLQPTHPDRVRCESYQLLAAAPGDREASRRRLQHLLQDVTQAHGERITLVPALVAALQWFDTPDAKSGRDAKFPFLN